MKQIDSIAGKCYIATAPNGGTVTDEAGRTLATVEAGEQKAVWGTDGKLYLSDDDGKLVLATFNYALAVAGLLGGGADKLPAGYTRVEFLQSTGGQQINTGRQATDQTCIEVKYADANISNWTPLVCTLSGYGQGYAVLATGTTNAVNGPRFDYGSNQLSLPGMDIRRGRHIIRKEGPRNFIDGVEVRANNSMPSSTWAELCLLHFQAMAAYTQCKLYSYKKWELGGAVQQHFVPALDPSGTPCMFDTVSKQLFRNVGSGQFIAGFTLAQTAQLGRKLPSSGGSLTVSLPEGYEQDERVVESLAQAEAKGWVLTIQTYAAQAAAATFALRRVWVRRVQDENGSYVAADGTRWLVEWCVDVIGADPELLGYERFRSVDAATEYWGLVPYEYPEDELSTAE